MIELKEKDKLQKKRTPESLTESARLIVILLFFK